jgi:hypothetical protein
MSKWKYAAEKHASEINRIDAWAGVDPSESFLEGALYAESKILNTLSMTEEERWLKMRNLEAENQKLREALEIISKMGTQTRDGHKINGPWTIAREALNKDSK